MKIIILLRYGCAVVLSSVYRSSQNIFRRRKSQILVAAYSVYLYARIGATLGVGITVEQR